MGAKDELTELRRLEELEAKASSSSNGPAMPQQASLGDKMIGGWGGRLLMGMASPVLAGAQLVGGETGRQFVADLEAAKRRGMAAEGNEGTDWYGILGALLPTGITANAVTKALPAATSVLGRAGLGAAQGAAVSAATPVTEGQPQDFWSDKAAQVGTGATMGGLIPLTIDAVKGIGGTVHKAVEPLYEKGRAAILQRYQESLLGDDPNAKQRVIQALLQAKELVPGSKPTAGEALAALDPMTGKPMIPEATGLMAHQQSISKMRNISPEFTKRAAEQEAARSSAIADIAQTPQALANAIEQRSAQAGQKYTDAYNVILKERFPKSLAKNPYVQDAMPDAIKLAEANGIDPKVNLTQFMHYVKIGLDKQLSRTGEGALHNTEKEAVQQAKTNLLAWLKQHNPAYDEARQTFADLSGPINRMEVGQQLANALESPLGTSERSGVFANAIREAPRTIKKATGQSVTDELGKILNPQEVGTVNAVAEDLARKDAFQRLARGTKISGSEAIPGNVGVPLPNLLSRPAMIANFLMRHAGASAEDKIAKVAAQQYLNPAQLAMGLQPPIAPRYQPVIDALMRQAAPAVSMTTARQF